jgi:tetratricopeptide (TPR) repeat protein
LAETVRVYDTVFATGETSPIARFRRAASIQYGTGDFAPLREVLTKYPDMEFAGGQTPARAWIAMMDHDYALAEKFLADSPLKDFQDIDFSFYFPKSWYMGMIAREKGDAAKAAAAYRQCREILAQRLVVKPEHARTIAVLAQVDASLGQKDLAVREAQHAIELMPISKDVYDGALVLEGLAQVYTWTGDRDRAIELLQKLISMPGYTNYGRLKLHPLWAPLRGDPRFDKIVASQAPR